MSSPICTAQKANGTNCTNPAKLNNLCGVHKNYRLAETHVLSTGQKVDDISASLENISITDIVPVSFPYNNYKLNLVFQDVQGTLALFHGLFPDVPLAITAYKSIADAMHINPEVQSRYGPAKQNRAVSFHSNVSAGYRYSGQVMPAQRLTKENTALMEYVNTLLGSNYNAILWNRYLPISDYLSQHADNEDSLGNTGVFSITLWFGDNADEVVPEGTSKAFRITNKPMSKDKVSYKRSSDNLALMMDGKRMDVSASMKVVDLQLRHGDMCLMWGDFQKRLEHGLPLSKKVKYTRVSATFRTHLV